MYAQYKDAGGATSRAFSAPITLDTTPPTLTSVQFDATSAAGTTPRFTNSSSADLSLRLSGTDVAPGSTLARMRVLPALALGVLACTPSAPAPAGRAAPTPAPASVRFAASGQSTAVPADFRDLEPARVDALRASAEREQPTATVTIAGKRAPEGLGHGMVYLQRGEAPREPTTRPRSVEATLFRSSYSHEPSIRFIGVWDPSAHSASR